MTEQKSKIFLSYAHEDIGMAKKIYQDLMRYGLDVWYDNESLLPGRDWKYEIERAIEASKYFLVLLSSRGMSERGYVHKEIRFALKIFAKCIGNDIFMIPIRLDNCQPVHRRLKNVNWIDLFPEGEYQAGLKKILQILSPESFIIRHNATEISSAEVSEMLKIHGYYDRYRNAEGKILQNQFNLLEINGDDIIIHIETGLMWQQSGSEAYMEFKNAEQWIIELNRNGFAGFHDWRLPTLEEAMSLMEPEQANGLCSSPIFDDKQTWIWTADRSAGESQIAWVVNFLGGYCSWSYIDKNKFYVRAVRLGNSSP